MHPHIYVKKSYHESNNVLLLLHNSDAATAKLSGGNFVRLNMKVKKYSRKGGMTSRTGSWHKRQAWKQKMKARSESGGGGGGACFKCGQQGHWAKNCKGNWRVYC